MLHRVRQVFRRSNKCGAAAAVLETGDRVDETKRGATVGDSLVVAAISTGVFYGLFAGRLRGASVDLPQSNLVVAAHDLERGRVIKTDDLKVTEVGLKTPFKC